jgi:hypothetical protein
MPGEGDAGGGVMRIALATLIADLPGIARALRLVRTWRVAADAAATERVVAVTTIELPAEDTARLMAEGVELHAAAGDWRPVLAAALPANVDQIVLLAAETVVVGDPRPLLTAGRVHVLPRAEPALSAARCRRIEEHFSLPSETFRQYEASVLVAPPALLGTFLRRWMELARSLSAATAVLGDEAQWRELVAFSLAVASCEDLGSRGERRVDLPVTMGFAAHTVARDDEQLLVDPVIVRGAESDATGALAYSPYPFAQVRCTRINRRLTTGVPPAPPPPRALPPAQVVVLGMHRSGTSALTGALALTGLHAGSDDDFPFADAANPRGYWEHLDVWAIDETLVRLVGRQWHDVTVADLARVPEPAQEELSARARRLIAGLDTHGPWMMKDPRHCVLLPFWLPLLSHPVAIVVYRDPLAVARSLAARDDLSPAASMAVWERYNAGALAASATIPRIVVAQHDLVERPLATIGAVVAALRDAGVHGLVLPDADALRGCIDPSLVHHPAAVDAPATALTTTQAELLARLESERIRVA